MAKLGFGMLVIMQNEWHKAAEDIVRFREMANQFGHEPPPPIILTNVSCAPSREEAHDRAASYLSAKWDSIDNHYHFSDGHLANVKAMSRTAKWPKTYTKMKDPEFKAKRRISTSRSRLSVRRMIASNRLTS